MVDEPGITRPVELVARRLACKNSKLQAHFDSLRWNGEVKVLDYMVVSSITMPANDIVNPLAQPTGVTVLPVRGQSVGLLRVFRHPMGAWGWEAPRGFIDAGEQAQDAALRELTEETGLTGTPADMVDLGSVVPEGGVIRARTVLFAIRNCVTGGRCEGEMGLGDLHWIELNEAIRMAGASEIEDATTVIALLRYGLLVV